MRILKEDLRRCLAKASEVCTIYRTVYLDGGATVRSVDNLVHLVETHEKKQVFISELNVDAAEELVRGAYLAFDDRYDVLVLKGQNFCWRRFVLCKELFHVLLDSDEYRNTRIGKLVEDFTNAFPTDDVRPGPAVTNELVAEICAMEFMFPYSDRVRISNGAYDSADVAMQYRIPKVYVERYLSPRYVENLSEFFEPAQQEQEA